MEDDTWDKIIGIGLIFGFLFLIYQASKQSQTKTAETAKECCQNNQQNLLAGWRPLSKIPSIDNLNNYQPMPINYASVPPINRQAPVPPVDRQTPVPPPISSAPTTTYKNNERWVIRRGEDGRIIDMNIIRDAKVNEL